jgi:hypothetical protein
LLKTYEYIKNNSLKVGLESKRFYGIYDLEMGLQSHKLPTKS